MTVKTSTTLFVLFCVFVVQVSRASAGLTAIIESAPISDPEASFHRFDVYLSSHGNYPILAEALGDQNWVLAVTSVFSTTVIKNEVGEVIAPRFISFRPLSDEWSVPGRSIRATYEIDRPNGGWEVLPTDRLSLAVGNRPVSDAAGYTIEGTKRPDFIPVRLPKRNMIRYALVRQVGEANAATPAPVELHYRVSADFILDLSRLRSIPPRIVIPSVGSGSTLDEVPLEMELLDATLEDDSRTANLSYRLSPDPRLGWGLRQAVETQFSYELFSLAQIGEPIVPVVQPDQISAQVIAAPIVDPQLPEHTFQVILESPGASIDLESLEPVKVDAVGGYREANTLIDLGHHVRVFVDEISVETRLEGSVSEDEGRRVTLNYRIFRPPSGWRHGVLGSRLPVFLTSARDAQGVLSVFPRRLGSIALAFADFSAEPEVSFEEWLDRLVRIAPSREPDGDLDDDGSTDLLEYAVGTNALDPAQVAGADVTIVRDGLRAQLMLTYSRSLQSKGVEVHFEGSVDGRFWENARGHFRLVQSYQSKPGQLVFELQSIQQIQELPWRLFRIAVSRP